MSSLRGQDDAIMDEDPEDNNNMDDDDNAQLDDVVDEQDPLVLAMDDLEGRVVTALDDIKSHPGVRSSPDTTIHEELATMLRPVLEVAAHTAPSVARTYYRGPDGVEVGVEEAYSRVVSDLVLPVLLEMAQSDVIPAKRATCLEFFRLLYKECSNAGSWLDKTPGPNAGPYGPGGSNSAFPNTPAIRALLKRRQQKALAREGEILRYWVEASNACLVEGVFTAAESEGSIVSRAILAASAALRPSLRHISQKIKDADDRGALRLYNPIMKMVGGVLRKLFVGPSETIVAACIKFLEIVVLCCSHRPQDPSSNRRRGQSTGEGFSLSDLPTGHPQITRENLESIAEYAFTSLRGMSIMAGQVKIDQSMIDLGRTGSSQTQQVVSILKPAALAYLEVESSAPERKEEDLEIGFDISRVEFDFKLAQKSYSLAVNALAAVAMQRPMFFKEASICLARRAIKPPVVNDCLSRTGALAIASQLRSSCLTLLRTALSITSGASSVLHKALKQLDMEIQADKALKMANQAHSLKTASRATRNQALVYYEWDASDSTNRSTKRQKETDDALAKMRAAKKARGLGAGIQLPTSMSDAVELVLLNLKSLPAAPSAKPRSKSGLTFDALVEAIMTNGSSLAKRGGGWYDREGGSSWKLNSQGGCVVSPQLSEAMKATKDGKTDDEKVKLYKEQCGRAAVAAYERILSSTSKSRNQPLTCLSNQLAARLSFLFGKEAPPTTGEDTSTKIQDAVVSTISNRLQAEKSEIEEFVRNHPLVATSITIAATASLPDDTSMMGSLSESLLNEALMQTRFEQDGETALYDRSLEWLVGTVVQISENSNDTPNNAELRKAAATASSNLRRYFGILPRLSTRSIELLCGLCDTQMITAAASDTSSKKSSHNTIANAAAVHAAKVASEKRATITLLILRDIAFQRDNSELRKSAVISIIGIATGRIPSSGPVHEKALKLLMNVLFPKSSSIEDMIVQGILTDLHWAAGVAVGLYDEIQVANKAAEKTRGDSKNPLAPRSDEEKVALDRMRKPTVVMMALCLRRQEVIRALFSEACTEKADVLSRTVRSCMSKLRGLAVKDGLAQAALNVAEMAGPSETPMLLSFLESLAPGGILPDQNLIEACFKIQENRITEDGKKDPRFLVPIVSSMKRKDLVERLPQFVEADDQVLLAALVRMGDKVHRQALVFRDEPDEENPSLLGLTLCEQLVFLHHIDFAAFSIPQRRYLSAIKLCLDDDVIYNDLVMKSALDHMSGMFLSGADKLPLAFMRTILLVCTKHETLHEWICKTLLKRLVEAEIFNDKKQWEGWMRCASMFQKDGDTNVKEAIGMLPPAQRLQYQSKSL